MQGQSERGMNSLAKARAELGITQEVLAVMLGVSRKYISMIETGAKPMSKKLSKKLALIMDGGGGRRCCGCRCKVNEREVSMTIQERALKDVLRERARQDEGWGEQNHDPQTYLSILIEEVGETAKEANDLRWWQANGGGRDDIRARLYEEAVQTAAVALAIVECLLRGKWRWPEQRERTEFAEVLRGLRLRGVITDEDVERLEREGVE